MSLTVEKITLQPHPMEAWAKALDALITCAPGSEAEIAQYLSNATRHLFVSGRKLQIHHLQVRAVQRLVAASGIDSDVLFDVEQQARHNLGGFRVNEFGFPSDAPLVGEPRQPSRADRTATAASPDSPNFGPSPESESLEAALSAAGDPARLPFQSLRPNAATHAPGHSPVPPASRSVRS
jgi:hypothetical protein